jgi:alcohol dehydrogenase class IV
MKSFSLARIPELIFGPGKLLVLPDLIGRYGKNVLLITGQHSFLESNHANSLFGNLSQKGIHWSVYQINHEPSPADIDGAVEQYKDSKPDVVVAIGGGSVIDAGKAISAMLLSPEKITTYLEGVGTEKPPGKKISFIAIPTTSGTGSEATKNAVITEIGPNGFKSSLRHSNYIPELALIDPELQLNCPLQQTACSGMDAFTQLLESYLSTEANPMTDALALDGINYINQSLAQLVKIDLRNIENRSKMAYAAWLSGITLANAGLGTVHGFASSIGSKFTIPHGVVCGTLMAETNRITLQKLSLSCDEQYFLNKYATVGRILSKKKNGSNDYFAKSLIDSLFQMTEELDIPRLSEFGISEADLDKLAAQTSNKNNPVKLSTADLKEILINRL